MKNIKSEARFEHLGYFKEYYIDNKFIGSVNYCEKDRNETGYAGRKIEITTNEVLLENKKKIKALTEVTTMLYPLCGKLLKS